MLYNMSIFDLLYNINITDNKQTTHTLTHLNTTTYPKPVTKGGEKTCTNKHFSYFK